MEWHSPAKVRRALALADALAALKRQRPPLPVYEWQGPPVAPPAAPVACPIDSDFTMSVAPAPQWWEVRQPVIGWRIKNTRRDGVEVHKRELVPVDRRQQSEGVRMGALAQAQAAQQSVVAGHFIAGGKWEDDREPVKCERRLRSGQIIATDVSEFAWMSRMVRKAG